ncbi:MAG: glycosyltransferase [Clostridia bacterium]|nr:glycosyltransferase [Clostridia bacterium]
MTTKVCILGHYGDGKNLLNGQTIKTKIITRALQQQLGQDQVQTIDTHGGIKNLLKAPFQVLYALKNSKNVLIFPAHNGLRVYAPLLFLLKHIFKNRKLHYSVIGGWLPQFLTQHKWLARILKHFDNIYVETNTMCRALEKQGFTNICVMKNCKDLKALTEQDLIYEKEKPLRLCTFSRVMKEKGIETAIRSVEHINSQLGCAAFSLDIYGQIDSAQEEWFDSLMQNCPAYVRYCGCVDMDKSVEVLRHYFALIFPTHFYTEGIPGTVIDAYAAGLPVISAKWESYADVIDDGITGIGYTFDNTEELDALHFQIAEDPQILLSMKTNCIKKAKEYAPLTAIQIMTARF